MTIELHDQELSLDQPGAISAGILVPIRDNERPF